MLMLSSTHTVIRQIRFLPFRRPLPFCPPLSSKHSASINVLEDFTKPLSLEIETACPVGDSSPPNIRTPNSLSPLAYPATPCVQARLQEDLAPSLLLLPFLH